MVCIKIKKETLVRKVNFKEKQVSMKRTHIVVRQNATRNESDNQKKLKDGRLQMKRREGSILFGCYHMLQHANLERTEA